MVKNDSSNTVADDPVDVDVTLSSLPPKLLERKIKADIDLADRKMQLEEMRANHEMALAERKEAFSEDQNRKMFKLLDSRNNEHWFKSYWRPAAGWVYLAICAMDFIIFPIMNMMLPIVAKAFSVAIAYAPWNPITLANGGLIHLAFAAILGVAAFTRGTERQIDAKTLNKELAGQ